MNNCDNCSKMCSDAWGPSVNDTWYCQECKSAGKIVTEAICPNCDKINGSVEFKTDLGEGDVMVCEDCYNEIEEWQEEEAEENQMLIHRMKTDPKMLRVLIKSKEARIKGIQWSLDWHLEHGGGSMNDHYYISHQEDIAREEGWLAEHRANLAAAEDDAKID